MQNDPNPRHSRRGCVTPLQLFRRKNYSWFILSLRLYLPPSISKLQVPPQCILLGADLALDIPPFFKPVTRARICYVYPLSLKKCITLFHFQPFCHREFEKIKKKWTLVHCTFFFHATAVFVLFSHFFRFFSNDQGCVGTKRVVFLCSLCSFTKPGWPKKRGQVFDWKKGCI